ncbi:sensor histidine kinase [Catellatospora methionotrophica]|uniref:sensor histidine kinase n=1 Tax=Catellatospora methionotrophica TaxID=121620 RepID=UPI0033E84F0B
MGAATAGTWAPPLRATTARLAAWARLGLMAVAITLVPLTVVPPVSAAMSLTVLALVTAWTSAYAYTALRTGLTGALTCADALITAATCLYIGQLVPLHQVTAGASWVQVLLTTCLLGICFVWPWQVSVPVGLTLAAVFALGLRLAGVPALGAGAVAVAQVLLIATVMGLVRRAGRDADATLTAAQDDARAAAIEQARRGDELRQLSLLHDTALATLTTIAAVDTTPFAAVVRQRSASDVRALSGPATKPEIGAVSLPERLAAVVDQAPPDLRVRLAAAECTVPGDVAEALCCAVGEALVNVGRHAGVPDVEVRVEAPPGRVIVHVADHGAGFDLTAVGPHRYGVRNSITGRLDAVGCRVHLASATGEGTRWTFEWPDE